MKTVVYSDNFQKNYKYQIITSAGKKFHPDFRPNLTPAEMLKLGVFGGAYFIGAKGLIPKDLPKSWFKIIKLSPDQEKHGELNYFGVSASQPLSVWQKKGWIYKDDPHGWFQWYCRYYLGRRIPGEDDRQIKRWKAIARHVGAIKKNCRPRDTSCRRKQRQALLHWAYDSRNI
ncbi:MAG TPA: hypothetical protein DEB09_00475 [Candidatus Magasanikbacteria bacterium]|nr:hypothetical protein [Candidatus Magasanikbacteria bacterium]